MNPHLKIRRPNLRISLKYDDFYWTTFYKHLAECDGRNKLAYEATEVDWEERFGTHRYSDYQSFRVGKYRHLKEVCRTPSKSVNAP